MLELENDKVRLRINEIKKLFSHFRIQKSGAPKSVLPEKTQQ